jgi:mannose-1-phosphate guanylyltransferase / mannose-6-phosphate isomerase
MTKITPVIMCGGSGTRLWPASRDSFPKQFLTLFDDASTFQNTLKMVGDRSRFDAPIVITNHAYRFLVSEQMNEVGCQGHILLEPERRDSAAAIAAACAWVHAHAPENIIAMMAADHVVRDRTALVAALADAAVLASQDFIVTLGMKPHYPATGYGYIQLGDKLNESAFKIKRFVEKPDETTATRYIGEGYVWNSGNFIFSPALMAAEIRYFEPHIAQAAEDAVARGVDDLHFHVLDKEAFAQAPKISIDYAVMEKTDKGAVIPISVGWSDIGTWASVRDHVPTTHGTNTIHGQGIALASHNVFIHSPDQLTTTVGLDNVIVITTDDAVLVLNADQAEKVKVLVDEMTQRALPQAREHKRIYRPWGYYQSVDNGERYQVKRIVVRPQGRLSLQKHHHRAEHWIVVKGTAEVVRDNETIIVHENQSIYLPIGCVHRLTNPGKINLELIEVQTGSYFGEDDIIRIEDDYHRTSRD